MSVSKRKRLIVLATFFFLMGIWALATTVFGETTVTVDDAGDAGDANAGDGVCATGDGACTLRAAIEEINAQGVDAVPHEIRFDLPGAGFHVIAPSEALPRIRVPVVIDGSTQPGATCPTADQPADLRIILDGSNLTGYLGDGLDLSSAGSGSHGSTIRGLVIGNFISGGITIFSDDNQIECNHIGLGADGVSSMSNGYNGINIYGRNNTIGGAGSDAQRNVIAGNDGYGGVYDSGDGGTLIANNYIGTTADGLNPLGNVSGLYLYSASNSTVGGASPLAANVISGNERYGIHMLGAEDSLVLGNLIGTGRDGVTPVANGWDGVFIYSVTNNNTIGGEAAGEGNRIAHNGDSGILVLGQNDFYYPENNALRGNEIFDNGDLGIDLGFDGVDENDALDADEGPNGRQNAPVLSSATSGGQILGSLESRPNQSYEIDFYVGEACDDSGYGQGESYLGSATVNTDGDGLAAIDATFGPGALAPGQSVTATATDASGNTSEFSACAFVDGLDPGAAPTWITDCFGATTPPPPPPPPPAGDRLAYLPLVSSGGGAPSGFPPAPQAEASPQTLELVDGGVVTGVDGVSLGAVAGTLSTTLHISITHTTAPTPTIITDPQIHGPYYHLTADENVLLCDQARGFVLGLPVPDGVPTQTLAIAAISPQSSDWAIVSGLYVAQSDLMLVPLSGLTEAGLTAVLVEGPGFSSHPEPATASPESTSQFEAQPQQVNNVPEFIIACEGDATVCSDVKDFLDLVYIEMSDMGYSDPNIPCALQVIGLNPPVTECIPDSHRVYVFTASCELADAPSGRYLSHLDKAWLDPSFVLCLSSSSQLFNVDKRAIRYHYFQATQYGWPEHLPVWTDWINGDVRYQHNDWVVDSTATAAMISIPAEMESTNDYERRPVDVPLTSIEEDYEFRAQDFWVFVGKSQAAGLTLIEPLFEQYGVTTQATIDWFERPSIFQDFYWNWAKNQVMLEDNVLLNDDDTGDPCTYQGHVEELYYNQLLWNDHLGLTNAPGTLQPLTAHVIELLPAGQRPVVVAVRDPKTTGVPDNLRYKVYVDGEAGCELVADNEPRTFSEEDWDVIVVNQSRVIVVVANADPDEDQKYEITVESVTYTP